LVSEKPEKNSSPLVGMMINKKSPILIRYINNGSLNAEDFLEKGLKELRQAYGDIYTDVLSNNDFNGGLGTYRDVLLYLQKQRDVSKYEDACDKLVEDITKIEGEVGKRHKTGIVERIAEIKEKELKRKRLEKPHKIKSSKKKKRIKPIVDYSEFLPKLPLDIQAKIDTGFYIR